MSENAYSYSFKDINEEDVINLSDYKGKTLVVVNTASLCGFTYQYDGLQNFMMTIKIKVWLYWVSHQMILEIKSQVQIVK